MPDGALCLCVWRLMPRWCSACGQLVCTPCSQAAAASAGGSSAERRQEVRACVGGERRCASLCCFSKTVGLGFVFFPDQKFIAAVIQTAHKAFFNMCKYLHFAVVLLYREQPLP